MISLLELGCYITDRCKTQLIKTTNIYHLCGSGIQVWLSWVPLTPGFSRSCTQIVSQSCGRIWRCGQARWVWVKVTHWVLAGLAPHFTGLLQGCLHIGNWLPWGEGVQERGREGRQDGSHSLESDAPYHFFYILFIRSKWQGSPYPQGEAIAQGWQYQ